MSLQININHFQGKTSFTSFQNHLSNLQKVCYKVASNVFNNSIDFSQRTNINNLFKVIQNNLSNLQKKCLKIFNNTFLLFLSKVDLFNGGVTILSHDIKKDPINYSERNKPFCKGSQVTEYKGKLSKSYLFKDEKVIKNLNSQELHSLIAQTNFEEWDKLPDEAKKAYELALGNYAQSIAKPYQEITEKIEEQEKITRQAVENISALRYDQFTQLQHFQRQGVQAIHTRQNLVSESFKIKKSPLPVLINIFLKTKDKKEALNLLTQCLKGPKKYTGTLPKDWFPKDKKTINLLTDKQLYTLLLRSLEKVKLEKNIDRKGGLTKEIDKWNTLSDETKEAYIKALGSTKDGLYRLFLAGFLPKKEKLKKLLIKNLQHQNGYEGELPSDFFPTDQTMINQLSEKQLNYLVEKKDLNEWEKLSIDVQEIYIRALGQTANGLTSLIAKGFSPQNKKTMSFLIKHLQCQNDYKGELPKEAFPKDSDTIKALSYEQMCCLIDNKTTEAWNNLKPKEQQAYINRCYDFRYQNSLLRYLVNQKGFSPQDEKTMSVLIEKLESETGYEGELPKEAFPKDSNTIKKLSYKQMCYLINKKTTNEWNNLKPKEQQAYINRCYYFRYQNSLLRHLVDQKGFSPQDEKTKSVLSEKLESEIW